MQIKEKVESTATTPAKRGRKPKVAKEIVEEGKKKYSSKETKELNQQALNDILVQDKSETNEFFLMRSAYAKKAAELFSEEQPTTHALLGYYGASNAKFGQTYPKDIQDVVDYINQEVRK